jgi:predicted enzyme related to lactoylglutathione lyase
VPSLPRIAPIFHVRDVAAALAFYAHLGFEARPDESGSYGFLMFDGVEIHVGVPGDPAHSGPSVAYLYVDDADELARRWADAGADVRAPVDTPWRMHEGVLVDPDHNVIRFGHRMT